MNYSLPLSAPATANLMLASVPRPDFARLPLEPLAFEQGDVLYNSGGRIEHVYFPDNAVISVLSMMEDGSSVEVGMIGYEGMVGMHAFFAANAPARSPHETIVQVAGIGSRMRVSALGNGNDPSGALHRRLLAFAGVTLTQTSQVAACNARHRIEARLSRWLLEVQNRVRSDELPLTQEYISQMLGARRSSVTVAAGELQDRGLIHYKRGRITVLDRAGMEAAACECYEVSKAAFDSLAA